MKGWLSIALVAALSAALIYGCTEEKSTNPWEYDGDGSGSDCIGCHADLDFLESVLGEEGVKFVHSRGDG